MCYLFQSENNWSLSESKHTKEIIKHHTVIINVDGQWVTKCESSLERACMGSEQNMAAFLHLSTVHQIPTLNNLIGAKLQYQIQSMDMCGAVSGQPNLKTDMSYLTNDSLVTLFGSDDAIICSQPSIRLSIVLPLYFTNRYSRAELVF